MELYRYVCEQQVGTLQQLTYLRSLITSLAVVPKWYNHHSQTAKKTGIDVPWAVSTNCGWAVPTSARDTRQWMKCIQAYEHKVRKLARRAPGVLAGKMISQLDSNVGRQSKAQDETNSLLKNLNTLMKSLVDVEQRKTTLVAQAAKAASSATANTGPASAPPGSAPAMAPGSVPAATAPPPATLGTGVVQTPLTPAVAPKLMPATLAPPQGLERDAIVAPDHH